ncbi:unnamed protein product [Spodoptera exigua]|nr:unnamed protein product [Spodoptera exigua]
MSLTNTQSDFDGTVLSGKDGICRHCMDCPEDTADTTGELSKEDLWSLGQRSMSIRKFAKNHYMSYLSVAASTNLGFVSPHAIYAYSIDVIIVGSGRSVTFRRQSITKALGLATASSGAARGATGGTARLVATVAASAVDFARTQIRPLAAAAYAALAVAASILPSRVHLFHSHIVPPVARRNSRRR